MPKRAERIEIDTKRCKGCGICVEFCPKQVLEMRDDKAVVVDLDACIACMLCEVRCPDYAIKVYEAQNAGQKRVKEVAG